MVAMLAFGGTYAYFTASVASTTDGTVVTGTLAMNGTLTLTNSTRIVPNQSVEAGNMAGITVTGTTISAYRIKLDIESIKKGEDDFTDSSNYITIAVLTAAGAADTNWTAPTQADGYLYYNKVQAGNTVATMDTIAAKIAVSMNALAGNDYQGLTVTYSVSIEATQAEYNGSTGALEDGASITADVAKALAWN